MSQDKDTVRKFYDDISDDYEALRLRSAYSQSVSKREQDFVLRHVADAKHILEIGPGTGRFTAKLVQRDGLVTAVDISTRMLDQIRHKLPSNKLRLIQGDFSKLHEIEGYGEFDAVVCMRVLPHVNNAAQSLGAIQAALRPGGNAIFDFWNDKSWIIAVRRILGRKSKVLTVYYRYAMMLKMIHDAELLVTDTLAWGYPRVRAWSLDKLGAKLVPSLAYSVTFNTRKITEHQ